MRTTLEEMQVLLTVVDTGALSRAAEQLGMAVSAVSRALARLEDKLGVTLLHRTTRRLQLSEEGAAFVEQARSIVAAAQAAEEHMRLRRQRPAGRLRVDSASPFLVHVVVPWLPGYRARYPDVQLELTSHEGIVDLLEHRTDVAVRIGALTDSSLHARRIGRSRLRLVASPAYLAQRGKPVTPADLAGHVRLGFTQPRSLNTWPVHDADGLPLTIEPDLAAASGEILLQMALAGLGIACLSDFMTRRLRASGALVQVLSEPTQTTWQPIHAVYYRNTPLAACIASFVDYLAERWRAEMGDIDEELVAPGPAA
ncbi:LysR family transcriptional regulator [Achromobacter sp. GG226]|uniref:LysR family transcriptional regulator n=1 Tax=Verticiella alkaliphila TaxID=2779529 RepID=UPI001C0B95E6|nr:LysR family transcriptional regulator [Verticiella sp. GG226]MBU4610107.1 LysR family transcriptional regulator [Verticiella sp. GG226]